MIATISACALHDIPRARIMKTSFKNALGNIEDVGLCQNCHLCLIKHQT